MAIVDEISPKEYGEDRIDLTLSDETPDPEAFSAVVVDVDYSRCLPAGVGLPLEMTVTGPSGAETFLKDVFKRFAPSSLAFVPREGGRHLVRLAEQHHNRWVGLLEVDVAGEPVREEAQTV